LVFTETENRVKIKLPRSRPKNNSNQVLIKQLSKKIICVYLRLGAVSPQIPKKKERHDGRCVAGHAVAIAPLRVKKIVQK